MEDNMNDMCLWEEYVKLIEKVADFVIENNASVRQVSKYFFENGIKISNYTVSRFLNSKELREYFPDKYIKVQEILKNRMSFGMVEDSYILRRMQRAIELLLKGFSVSQIAEKLNSTTHVIYHDLTSRLLKMGDEELMRIVSVELEKDGFNNLIGRNKMVRG